MTGKKTDFINLLAFYKDYSRWGGEGKLESSSSLTLLFPVGKWMQKFPKLPPTIFSVSAHQSRTTAYFLEWQKNNFQTQQERGVLFWTVHYNQKSLSFPTSLQIHLENGSFCVSGQGYWWTEIPNCSWKLNIISRKIKSHNKLLHWHEWNSELHRLRLYPKVCWWQRNNEVVNWWGTHFICGLQSYYIKTCLAEFNSVSI